MRIKMLLLTILALALFAPVYAQSTPAPTAYADLEPITIDNADSLIQLPGALMDVSDGFDLSPDGKQVAVARPDGVYLYDMGSFETPAKIFAVSGADQVYGPQFSPDGQLLAVNAIFHLELAANPGSPGSDYKSTVQLWDVATGTLKTELIGRLGLAGHPIFSPDGQYVAGKNSLWQTIKLPTDSYSEIQIWKLNKDFSAERLCCPDSDLFGNEGIADLEFSSDSLLLLWSLFDTDYIDEQPGYVVETFWRLEYLPSTFSNTTNLGVLTAIVSGRPDHYVYSEGPFTSDVRDVEFSSDGVWLAAIGENSTIWAVKTAEKRATLAEGSQFSAFLPDNSIIAINEPQHQLYVTDLDQRESILLLESFDPAQQTILLNPDGRILALEGNETLHFYGVPAESKSTL
jgi:WD40 repeat protein